MAANEINIMIMTYLLWVLSTLLVAVARGITILTQNYAPFEYKPLYFLQMFDAEVYLSPIKSTWQFVARQDLSTHK